MLAEAVIRIGRPIMKSNLPKRERIRWLTDVSNQSCKNYFQNVYLVELGEKKDVFHKLVIGEMRTENQRENFYVDEAWNVSFPVFFPNGGNPLCVQGVYPLPCYLMWDPHIKKMNDFDEFANKILLPRINNTVSFWGRSDEEKERLAQRVVKVLVNNAPNIISEDKQLGVLMIFDERVPVFKRMTGEREKPSYLWLTESLLFPNQHLFLDEDEALQEIVTARFEEASTLGKVNNAVSTFTNEKVDEAVSIYNKSWLWLSPTWEMPCSIYWGKDEWTKGIKIDRESYEAFLYGTQFLKQIQVPVSNTILKEVFAPTTSAEARKYISNQSIEPIYGIPMVLPLLDGDSEQVYKKYRRMLKNDGELSSADLHLDLLAGLRESIVPESSDDYRLTILYYSGDLSRGAMHIRAVIEDVIPSVAHGVQEILQQLNRKELPKIQKMFALKSNQVRRLKSLPSLLGSAYGAGYLWSSLQAVLHRRELRIERFQLATMKKLNELANKEDYWGMKYELVFYYGFLYFLKHYEEKILGKKEGVRDLADWQNIIEAYHQGDITLENINSPETLGFVTGLLLKQFSNSYYAKTEKDFVKHRVMKFGSKLTPEMIWKNGLLRCEELAKQWDMKLAANYWAALPLVLLAFLEAEEQKWLVAEKEKFMTAFWSGYLIYKKVEEVEKDVS